MSLGSYHPPNDRIIHETEVDFINRDRLSTPVHLVQGDKSMPIVAVSLYKGGQPYAVPGTAEGNVRWKKPAPDIHFVYNPLLGVNDDRTVAYFEVTPQMTTVDGRVHAIVEIVSGSNRSGSSPLSIFLDRDPVQESDIEDTNEVKTLQDYVDQAADSANEAKASQTAAAKSATAASTSEKNAKASQDAAKASQTAAETSASNASTSATAAKASQDAAKASQTAAAGSASDAAGSASSAEESATQADSSAAAAEASATNAKASQTAAKTSQDAAKASQDAAKASQTAAATSATNAEAAKDAAKASQTAAAGSASEAAESASSAEDSATAAKASQTAAATSEKNAKASQDAAKASQTAAATSATNAEAAQEAAEASATAAAASETNAKASQDAAKASQTAAANSASAAATSEKNAKTSQTAAASSATAASNSASSSSTYAQQSKSYAVGGTGTRDGEDTDNSKYYYDQSKRIAQGFEGALVPMGTIAFADLKNQTKLAGNMYNISNAFTTDATFKEGSGHAYPAGTNVYYTADGYWDALAGYQVTSVNGEVGAIKTVKSVNDVQGDVIVGGRNYIIQKDLVVGFLDTTGKVVNTSATDSQASRTTDYIDISATNNLTMSVSGVPQSVIIDRQMWCRIAFYDADKAFIKYNSKSVTDAELGAYYKLVLTVTKPANAVYARASFYYTNIENCQAKLEFGNVATDWSPAPEDKLDSSYILVTADNKDVLTSTPGTAFFNVKPTSGIVDQFPSYDLAIMQVSSGKDAWQFFVTDGHLWYRQNDSNNASAADWPATFTEAASVKDIISRVFVLTTQYKYTQANIEKWGTVGVDTYWDVDNLYTVQAGDVVALELTNTTLNCTTYIFATVRSVSADQSRVVTTSTGWINVHDTGAVPTTRKVNNKALSADITLSAADVSAVPTGRKVNNKALSADISLTASDVGALPLTGGTLTGNLTLSGATNQSIRYTYNGSTFNPIVFYAGGSEGAGVVIGAGGLTIVGAGEAATTLHTALLGDGTTELHEQLHLASDSMVYVHTGVKSEVAEGKTFTFDANGVLSVPSDGAFSGALNGVATNVSHKLTFTGGSTVTYDGSSAQSVAIPTLSSLGAVPTSRTVNSKALSANISLTAADVGAVPTSRTINGLALSNNIMLTATDVNAVPTGRKVNNKALSADISLTASDVAALPLTGGMLTGDLELQGTTSRAIKYSAGQSVWSPIQFFRGSNVGYPGTVIGAGGLTIVGGGDAAMNLHTALVGSTSNNNSLKQLHLASDYSLYLYTNCSTIADRKTFTFGTNGKIVVPSDGAFVGNLEGNATSASKVANKLTFTGGSAATYDGSAAVSVAIPSANDIFLAAHPIGSLVLTSNSTAPSPGTWGILGQMLIGSGRYAYVYQRTA